MCAADYNLNGPLPSEVVKLTKLQDLILAKNILSGVIPTELGCLLPSLRNLEVQVNHLEGTIPPQLFVETSVTGKNTASLNKLSLSENRLTGSLPTEIGKSQWGHLYFSSNKLSGSLPRRLFDTPNLALLHIQDNAQVGR